MPALIILLLLSFDVSATEDWHCKIGYPTAFRWNCSMSNPWGSVMSHKRYYKITHPVNKIWRRK